MKRAGIVCLLLLTAALAGCGESSSTETNTNNNRIYEDSITLKDGRVVVCLTYSDGYRGGLDCDWNNAR